MITPAASGQEPAIEAFLSGHAASSMFLRSNLHGYGLFEREDFRGTTFFVQMSKGVVAGVFGVTNHGFLMAQAPEATSDHWQAFAEALRGREFKGMTGVPDQVDAAMASLGVQAEDLALHQVEPLYTLDLSKLPDDPIPMRQPVADDIPLLADWFANYEIDTQTNPDRDTAANSGRARAQAAVKGSDVRLLVDDGRDVAMSGLNAKLPDTVQIGGVYTPPDLRNQGYGRRAVAGHLQECRAAGVKTAVLFANNAAAARAYEGIGFKHVGGYKVALLRAPKRVGRP